MRILVVDDSIVFRTQITASLTGVPEVEVVGSAPNGRIALQKLEQLSVELITLDMEMPELNGLETLRELRSRGFKTKVIIFSSQTTRGAEKALQALAAGADDVVAKPEGDTLNFDTVQEMIRTALVPRVRQFIDRSGPETLLAKPLFAPSSPKSPRRPKQNVEGFLANAVVLACSTGGPSALEAIFSHLKGPFKKPLLVVQHMPPVFTNILAKRLATLTGADFVEASDGEPVVAGRAYVAPGDFHMSVVRRNNKLVIKLDQEPLRNSVRPAADFLFESAAAHWNTSLLGVVLTGMGEDGAAGAHELRKAGGRVVIQNKESCVVFGMPGAVFANDDYDELGDLVKISRILQRILT